MLYKNYFVYLLTSQRNGTLYLGVTNDLMARVWTHKQCETASFTRTYGVDRLVWFEIHNSIEAAIQREKQIKRWRREWKLDLFRDTNPNWDDLYPSLAKHAS